jgi:hypothetical protein
MSEKINAAITASHTLADWEKVIADSLPNAEAASFALLQIHDHKLYRQGHRSFEEYLQTRWHLSRSRGYQLLRFAKHTLRSIQTNTPGPQNERQARNLAADGTPQKQDRKAIPVSRVVQYVADALQRHPPQERRQFIQEIRQALALLEQELEFPANPGLRAPQLPIGPNQRSVIDHTQLIVENELP